MDIINFVLSAKADHEDDHGVHIVLPIGLHIIGLHIHYSVQAALRKGMEVLDQQLSGNKGGPLPLSFNGDLD